MEDDPHYEPFAKIAHYAGHAVRVADKEGRAFEYLAKRLGQVVSRAELERDVWKMAPGVKSETVPVTMRTLRRKLTFDGEAAIETVRGLGYRLLAPQRPAQWVELPAFPTPYQARPREQDALRAMIGTGFRVITVLGPEGSGRTRLTVEVARGLEGRVAFCELSGDPAGVEQDLLRSVGVESNELTDLDRLDGPLWILVDGIGSEAVSKQVRLALDRVKAPRFLITSNRPLGLEGEALHTVGPLDGEAGRRFLEGRLAAAPWRQHPSNDTLDRAVRVLDGLPLGLELLAAHPEPLERLLDGLEAGQLPIGPEGRILEQVLTTAVEGLEPHAVDVLIALASCEGALTLGQIDDWLGADGQRWVRELAARAIVVPQGPGWRLRNTMRAYLRRTRADDVELRRASFQAWLTGMFPGLRAQWFGFPRATWSVLQPLLDDFHALLDVVEDPLLSAIAWWLQEVYESKGPRLGVHRMLHGLERRLGVHPLTEMLRIIAFGLDGPLPSPGREPSPYLELFHLRLSTHHDRSALEPARYAALIAIGDPVLTQVTRSLMALADPDDLDGSIELLKAVCDASHDYPALWIDGLRKLAWMMSRRDAESAVPHVRLAVRLAERHQLPVLVFRSRWGLAAILNEVDLELGAEAALEGVEALRAQTPREVDALSGLAGITLFALGDDDRAAPVLEQAMRYPSRSMRPLATAIRAAVALRRDEPDAGDRAIRTFDTNLLLMYRRDMSRAGDVFKRFLEAEVALHAARRNGDEPEVMARLLAEREAEARADDPNVLIGCLATLRRRAIALGISSGG